MILSPILFYKCETEIINYFKPVTQYHGVQPMTDNAILKHLPRRKTALTGTNDEKTGSLFQMPKIWEVDASATGDSWCD